MAIIQCPECGHQISDQAGVCPNCGYVLKKKKLPIKLLIAGGLLLVCAALGVFAVTQTTVFWSQDDKILLECAQQVQKDLLAPDSLILYNAGIVHGEEIEEEEPSDAVSGGTESESDESLDEVMVYIYYGAGTKAGGITDGICALEKDNGEWEKYSYHEDLDSFEGLDAVTPALENIQIEYTLHNIQNYGKEYSSESLQRVADKLTK